MDHLTKLLLRGLLLYIKILKVWLVIEFGYLSWLLTYNDSNWSFCRILIYGIPIQCNGELKLLKCKTPPVLIHRWITTPSVLIFRWNKTPSVNQDSLQKSLTFSGILISINRFNQIIVSTIFFLDFPSRISNCYQQNKLQYQYTLFWIANW